MWGDPLAPKRVSCSLEMLKECLSCISHPGNQMFGHSYEKIGLSSSFILRLLTYSDFDCDPIRYLSSACACFAWECHLCPVPRLITALSLTGLFIWKPFTREPQRVDVTADNNLYRLLVFVTLSSCMAAPFYRNTIFNLYPLQKL